MKPAVAVSVQGDKNSFYRCAFIGVQDTLFDAIGRHFFRSCYIEGAVDFIFGDGTSMYQVIENPTLSLHIYIYTISLEILRKLILPMFRPA